MLPAAIVALRLAWGLEASHRLAAEQAAMRSQGIAVTPTELPDPSKIPPDQDAVRPFVQAQSDFKLGDDDNKLVNMFDKTVGIDRLDRVTFTPDEISNLRRIWSEHQDVITDLDRSQTLSQCAWPNDYHDYFGIPSQYSIAAGNTPAKWLCEKSIIDAADHHDADALRNLRRAVNIGRITRAQPMFISWLVAGAIEMDAIRTFERLEPALDWNNPAVIQEARSLLQELQQFDGSSFLHAWSPEIAFLDYEVGKQREIAAWWLRPLWDDDEARGLQKYAANLPAARAASFPEFKSRLVVFPAAPETEFSQVLLLFSKDEDLSDNYGLLVFLRAVDIKAGECLLAARLSNHDHGRFPMAVAEMVPQYLPRLPADPFDPGGKPLRYRLDPGGPTVWSVGENGVDDGAKFSPRSPASVRAAIWTSCMRAAWRALSWPRFHRNYRCNIEAAASATSPHAQKIPAVASKKRAA